MQNIFDSRALKITDLILIFVTGATVLLIIEVEKQMRFALKRQQEG